MICMASPVTLTVDPTATAPALTLRPWQDRDIPTIVAAYRDAAMRRWLVNCLASRCVQTATEWLFGGQDIMPADEIELLHTVGNEGSCRVAQKCG
jgi:hypothetical protein